MAAVEPKRKELDMPFDEAVDHVRECLKAAGFGMVTELSVHQLLKEKIGVDRDRYHVLGACNPKLANKALDLTLEIGGLFPCNTVVYEEEDGTVVAYHVSIMKTAKAIGLAPRNDEWEEIIRRSGEMTVDAFERM